MPGFDPDEPRDSSGRWTDGTAEAIRSAASDNKLTDQEKKLLNGEYETEQQFKEAYEAVNANQSGTTEKIQSGTTDRGSGGGEGQVSEQKKEWLDKTVTDYIDRYGKNFGAPGNVPTKVLSVDADRAKQISDSYDAMPVTNNSPEVINAYKQLAKEVDYQFSYLKNDVGIKFAFSENDPYKNSAEMMSDVTNNKTLRVYSGGEDHPLLGSITKDSNGLTANEKFRAVHDYYGHAVEQNQFGKLGEERAWVAHSKMFSPLAQKAMTTETRGQNSWVNFSGANDIALKKMADGNKLIKSGRTTEGQSLLTEGQKEFKFAIQKTGLLPDRFTNWRVYAR